MKSSIRDSFMPLFILCSVVFLLAGYVPVIAQPSKTTSAKPDVTAEQISSAQKAVESDTTLSEDQKQKILEMYSQASNWLQEASANRGKLNQLNKLIKEAPKRIESLRRKLAKPVKDSKEIAGLVKQADLAEIDQRFSEIQLQLSEVRKNHNNQLDTLSSLLVGTKGISEEVAAKVKAIEKIDTDLKTLDTTEPGALSSARELFLKTRRVLHQAELDSLRVRLDNHDLLTNLAQVERDFAAAEIARLEQSLAQLQESAQSLREVQVKEARQEAEELKAKTATFPPGLQTIADQISQFRLEQEELVVKEKTVSEVLTSVAERVNDIKTDFERTRQRVKFLGTNQAVGKMLLRRRDDLPSLQTYRRSADKRRDEINRVTDRQIHIDELLRERENINLVIEQVLAAIPPELMAEQKSLLEQETRALVQSRRSALNELQQIYGRYIGQLASLDLAQRQLVEVAEAYVNYIDDRLIWTPKGGINTLLSPHHLVQSLIWILSPDHWIRVLQDLFTLSNKQSGQLIVSLLLFLIMRAKKRTAKQRLQTLSRATLKIRTDSFALTILTLGYTLILAGVWPLLMIAIGYTLALSHTAEPFTIAMANALLKSGLILAGALMVRRICLPDGLGDKHLRWPQAIRSSLVHELNWLIPVAVPINFLIALYASHHTPHDAQIVGQLGFMSLMIVSMVFVYRLLNTQSPFMAAWRGSSHTGIVYQLHFLWFPSILLLAIALTLISAFGYQNMAIQLQFRVELTFWFFLGLFLLKDLLLRYLYIAQRKLRYEDALKRREELKAQREREESHEEEPSPVSVEVPQLNFDQLGEQAKRLVRTGFLFGAVIGTWTIWSELLPALGFLNNVEFPFYATRMIDGVPKEVPVTLGDMVIGIIMLLVTVLAAKNIPGVLEITLLQRLPLEAGARYALTTLSQYLIVGIGIVISFSSLGFEWTSIQWLVAALGVGLGFGLQEIVANFISGIILLFERPIRVGDVVTIDNTTGVVSRIKIRATTIINWDKQELLVPNKEFVTGRLINWTLSDQMNRIIITVGVAYGSDVPKAMKLMVEAAQENPNVLQEPPPFPTFEGFGDNSLTLLIRCYLGSMENRLATISAMHQAINDKFNAAGIVIAFPQRDIHLDTFGPLDVRIQRFPGDDK